jgi:anti-anti-sigma factor
VEIDLRGPVDVLCIRVRGEVDMSTAPQLRTILSATGECDGSISVIVDLRDVTFMDSSGFVALAQAHRDVTAGGAAMQVINTSPTIAAGMRATGVAELLGATTRLHALA